MKRISEYKVWKDGNHPILLNSKKLEYQKINYIHKNPVEDEIVDEPEAYLYSSARDYMNENGLLDVELLH